MEKRNTNIAEEGVKKTPEVVDVTEEGKAIAENPEVRREPEPLEVRLAQETDIKKTLDEVYDRSKAVEVPAAPVVQEYVAPKTAQKKSGVGRWFRRSALAGLVGLSGFAAKGQDNHKLIATNVDGSTIEKTASYSESELGDQVSQDWQKYLSFLDGKHLKGSALLDHNKLGARMINEYRAEHPGTTISNDLVKDLQRAFRQYREDLINKFENGDAIIDKKKVDVNPKSPSFGQIVYFDANPNAKPKPTGDKLDVFEKTIMPGLSTEDGIAGQLTTSHRWPEAVKNIIHTYYMSNDMYKLPDFKVEKSVKGQADVVTEQIGVQVNTATAMAEQKEIVGYTKVGDTYKKNSDNK